MRESGWEWQGLGYIFSTKFEPTGFADGFSVSCRDSSEFKMSLEFQVRFA